MPDSVQVSGMMLYALPALIVVTDMTAPALDRRFEPRWTGSPGSGRGRDDRISGAVGHGGMATESGDGDVESSRLPQAWGRV